MMSYMGFVEWQQRKSGPLGSPQSRIKVDVVPLDVAVIFSETPGLLSMRMSASRPRDRFVAAPFDDSDTCSNPVNTIDPYNNKLVVETIELLLFLRVVEVLFPVPLFRSNK